MRCVKFILRQKKESIWLEEGGKIKRRVKLSRKTSWRLRSETECWASILTLTFGTARTAELSALRSGRTLPPRKLFGTHFCYRLSGPQRYWTWTAGTNHLTISKDPTEYRVLDLLPCGAVPQTTATAPGWKYSYGNMWWKLTSTACTLIYTPSVWEISYTHVLNSFL